MHTLLLTLVALLQQGADSPDPAKWPVATRDGYLRQGEKWDQPKELVGGKEGLIGGTTGPLAIHVGRNILRNGGTAADAVVATSLCQVVLSGGSWNSFGGIAMGMYFDAKTKRVYAMNATYNTVQGETDPLTIPATKSGRTALVPGYFAGVCEFQKRFGKLRSAEVFAPSITLARDGYPADAIIDYLVKTYGAVLSLHPEAKAIFSGPSGEFIKRGEPFRQTALANMLSHVATDGPSYIYKGDWARHFVDAVDKDGGKFTMKDLADYRAMVTEPIRTKFHEFELCAIPAPSFGGVDILEAMNMVEVSDLKSQPSKDAASLKTLISISRFSWLQDYGRARLDNDDAKDPFAPVNRLKKENAKRLLGRTSDQGWQVALYKEAGRKRPMHSDCLVAIDREGNVAVLLHSINTLMWGKTGLFVDGVSIPDSASFQQGVMARVKPGSRLPDITNPVIVLKNGKPYLACGCIGAALNESMLQNLVNILQFGMDPKASVEGPMFWGAGRTLPEYYKQSVTKGAFSKSILDDLHKLGQDVVEVDPVKDGMSVSEWIGALLNPATGQWKGCLSLETSGLFEGF